MARWTTKQMAGKAKAETPRIPETIIQQQVVKWFAYTYPKIYATGAFFSVPNEGKRTRATASRMKAEGMVSGVCDLMLLKPGSGYYSGLLIEMKAEGGRLTDNQRSWLIEMYKNGFAIAVCYSFEQATQVISEYIAGSYQLGTNIELEK